MSRKYTIISIAIFQDDPDLVMYNQFKPSSYFFSLLTVPSLFCSDLCSYFLFILSTCHYYMSQCMRKPTLCIGKSKDADQLRSNCEADQRLCFRYTDSTISLLLKSEISSFLHASVTVHAALFQTWSVPIIVGFLMHRLIFC